MAEPLTAPNFPDPRSVYTVAKEMIIISRHNGVDEQDIQDATNLRSDPAHPVDPI